MIREKYKDKFENALTNLQKGKGSSFIISGETGIGKTQLLDDIIRFSNKKYPETVCIYADTQEPISGSSASKYQPLRSFISPIKQIVDGVELLNAKQRFGKNTALTLLTAIPFAGDLFYAVKEISKDWQEYKNLQMNEDMKSSESDTIIDFYNAIHKQASKKPLVLILDDAHWADTDSIALMEKIIQNAYSLPIFFIITIRPNEAVKKGSLLNLLIEKAKKEYDAEYFEIEPLSRDESDDCAIKSLKGLKAGSPLLDLLYERTSGVPGSLTEYLKYYQLNSPFDENGKLLPGVADGTIVPPTAHNALALTLNSLSNEERYILAYSASEGREFSVYLLAKILNVSVLDTIKKLKSITNNTDIIASLGATERYGIKTTIYKFTQTFYFDYFKNFLEYEESKQIHSVLAHELKVLFDAGDDDIKQQIASVIAEHSISAEDTKLADSMMKIAEGYSLKFSSATNGNQNLNSQNVSEGGANVIDKNNGIASINSDSISSILDIQDFLLVRKEILNLLEIGQYESALQNSVNQYESNKKVYSSIEKAQLFALAIRANVFLNNFAAAEALLERFNAEIDKKKHYNEYCLWLNMSAFIEIERKDYKKAITTLKKAAEISLRLSPELRLMTIANIAVAYHNEKPAKAVPYLKAAIELAKELDYTSLEAELGQLLVK